MNSNSWVIKQKQKQTKYIYIDEDWVSKLNCKIEFFVPYNDHQNCLNKSLGQFDSRKDSQPTKLKQQPWIIVKLSFRELCNSNLSSLHNFDNTAISLSQKMS